MSGNDADQRRPKSEVVRDLPTKSAKIRALDAEGYSRIEIRDYLKLTYQHVRNVLVSPAPKAGTADRRKDISEQVRTAMDAACRGEESTSARMRALHDAGFATGDIARYLNKRYQHAYNVIAEYDRKRGTKQLESGLAEDATEYAATDVNVGDPHRPDKPDQFASETPLNLPVESASRSKWAKVGPNGQVEIPAPMLDLLGLKPGDDVVVRHDNDELRITPRDTAIKRAQAILRRFVPEGVSLVDELIAERRAEAARESGDEDGSNR